MTRRRAGVAVMLVAAAAMAWFFQTRDNGGRALRVRTGSGTAGPMVPSELPPGLRLAAALDLPLAGGAPPQVSLVLYGEPGAADPFARGDLAVFSTTIEGAEPALSVEEEPVEVRGRPGSYTRSFAGPQLGLKAVRWMERDRLLLEVVSRSLSRYELLAAAAALDVAADGTVAARPLPRGLRLVARQADASVPPVTAPVPMGAAGHLVSYVSTDDGSGPQRYLLVGSHAGGPEALAVLTWFYGPTTRAQSVAGSPGRLATVAGTRTETCEAASSGGPGAPPVDPPPPRCSVAESEAYVLAWTTADGVVVVSSSGVSRSDLLAAAASVSVVDDAAWRQLKADVQATERSGAESGAGSAGPATTLLPVA